MNHLSSVFSHAALFVLFLGTWLTAAQAQIHSGPMLGYSTMREVAVWVQTDDAARVQLKYWSKADPETVFHSDLHQTQERSAYCATLIADSLQEGTTYRYEILVDGKQVATPEPLTFSSQPHWAYRTDPPDFTFALGSCIYVNEPAYDRPGKAYGGPVEILTAIDKLRPELMLWMGDNIYLREGDFQSRSGIYHRYTHNRQTPEMQPLLRHSHNYATWDDHDYGPNDSDRSYVHKDWTREAFDDFWANPPTNHPALQPGIGTHFRHVDVEFFVLDNRTFRAPNDCKTCEEMPLLGEEQVDWLIDALVGSTASYKFILVGGQVVNDAPVFENFAANFAEEREDILDRISTEGIKNVIFLTGDRHHTELSRVNWKGTEFYDFTVSPLTAHAVTANQNEGNHNRVPGTWVGEHNFGTVTVTGPASKRKLILRIYDKKGKMLWERKL